MSEIAHILITVMEFCVTALWVYITWLITRDLRHKFWPSLMAWLLITFMASGIVVSLLYFDGQL